MKAVSRSFKAYQNLRNKTVSSYETLKEKCEYPDVGSYEGNPTCLNLFTDDELRSRCLEDHHYCPGRNNCPYVPKLAEPIHRTPWDIPDVDEVYNYHSNLPIPVIPLPNTMQLESKPVKLLTKQEYEQEYLPVITVSTVNPVKLRTRHGCSKHPLYQKWKNMCNSCYEETDKLYAKIGAKGIQVCQRWHDVRNFIEDFPHYELNSKLRFKRLNQYQDFNPENFVLN
jgi:hypothetical protein